MLLTYCVRSRFIVGILRVLRRRWKQSKVEIKELHMVPCCSSRLLWCSLSLLLLSDSFVPLCFGCCCCCCSQIVSNQIAAGAAADLFLICLLPGCCCWCWELRRIERIRSCDTLFTSSSSLLCSSILYLLNITTAEMKRGSSSSSIRSSLRRRRRRRRASLSEGMIGLSPVLFTSARRFPSLLRLETIILFK